MAPATAEVEITDVLLRDGLQMESVIVPTDVKVDLAAGLLAAGVSALEVGSFVHPGKVPQMADTDDLLARLLATTDVALPTLVFNRRGAERAAYAGARIVRLVVSASEGHSRSNAGVGVGEALDRLQDSVKVLDDHDIAYEACVATAFVCPFDGDTAPGAVADVVERLLGMGAIAINVADTIGAAHPSQVARLMHRLYADYPDANLAIHLHNTYGMAAANVMAAIEAGVRRFDAALGGLGGCPFAPGAAGNIATDDLVHLLAREGISTGIDPDLLGAVRAPLERVVGHRLESAMSRVDAGATPDAPQSTDSQETL